MSDQYVAKRKNELFKRIKPSTLSTIINQDRNGESVYNYNEIDGENINNITNQSRDLPDSISL